MQQHFRKLEGGQRAPSPRACATPTSRKDTWGNVNNTGKAFVDFSLDNNPNKK